LANTVDHKICSQSRLGGGSSLGLLIGLILFSFPAQFYRVSGVWAAIDSQFPIAANETCIAVKTFGVEAVRSCPALDVTTISDVLRSWAFNQANIPAPSPQKLRSWVADFP
jgi:hypothetical protein